MALVSTNFVVEEVDKEGKIFDNVSRIYARSENGESSLELDINSQIYSLPVGQAFTLAIDTEIAKNRQSENKQHWHPSILDNSIASQYDYVMHGTVYRYEVDLSRHQARIYVSFGGLLMSFSGDQHTISNYQQGKEIYIFIRKKIA